MTLKTNLTDGAASAMRNIGSANIDGERARLARPHARRSGARPPSREHDRRDRDEHLADEDDPEDDVDAGREVLDQQRDRGRDEQHAVGGGVENLAELAALVVAPRDLAVDPVGRAEHGEQRRRATPGRVRLPRAARGRPGRSSKRADRDDDSGIVRTR